MTDFPLDVGKFPPSMRYAVNTADPSESPFTHEDCDDPRAAVKVVQRFDGTTDASQCSPGTQGCSVSKPSNSLRTSSKTLSQKLSQLSVTCRSEPGTQPSAERSASTPAACEH